MSDSELPSAAKRARVESQPTLLQELHALPLVQSVLAAHADVTATAPVARATCSTRAYEEQYLREHGVGEQACCNGLECEGMQLLVPKEQRAILRAFDVPGSPARGPRMCLLCLRKHALSSMLSSTVNHPVVQCEHAPIYNLVGVPGEYSVNDVLICDAKHMTTAYLPLVMHRRSQYTVERRGGVLHVLQSGFASPDF